MEKKQYFKIYGRLKMPVQFFNIKSFNCYALQEELLFQAVIFCHSATYPLLLSQAAYLCYTHYFQKKHILQKFQGVY